MKENHRTLYALYRGDKFIDIGTAKQLADKIGVRPKTIYYYQSPASIKKHNGRGYVVVKA